VVHALGNIDRALVAGGLVIDTQPVSPHPVIDADAAALGTLDMSEWACTVDQIDRLAEQSVCAGLFTVVGERRFTVTDRFDTGAELVAVVTEWAGTRIDPMLGQRIAVQQRPVHVQQEVRLRVLQTRRQRTGSLRRGD
jgi:hypothetical protein